MKVVSVNSRSSEKGQALYSIASIRVGMTIVLWILASVVIAGLTFVGAQALAPGWVAGPDEITTLMVAEVYTVLIATLFVVFGGREGVRTALRLRAVPTSAYIIAFVAAVVAVGVVDLAYIVAGAGTTIGAAYMRVGTDGGRLGTIGPVMAILSIGRACVLAPVGEELLFRGAIYGWSRRWLPAWPAIVLNSVVWGLITGVIDGSFALAVPRAILNGSVLTWIREHTNSTLPGIAVHIAHNTIVVLVVYLLIGR